MLTLPYKIFLLLESWWYLQRWDRVIRKQAFEQWQQYLNSPAISKTQLNLSTAQIQAMRKAIDAIVRRSSRELNCMRRCLALKSMIERRNGHCRMHIGVKFEPLNPHQQDGTINKVLRAHAWLSVNGKLVNDTLESVSQYQEITHSDALFASAATSPMP